jgi:hypothetical protein
MTDAPLETAPVFVEPTDEELRQLEIDLELVGDFLVGGNFLVHVRVCRYGAQIVSQYRRRFKPSD